MKSAAKIAAGARLALDDELPAEHFGHLLRDDARDGIGAAAGRERDVDADRAVRPAGLADGGAGETRGQRSGGCEI